MKRNYRKETFSSRAEWLAARGFGGSSASAILGCNPWMSAIELYNTAVAEKKGPRKEDRGNAATEYGTKAEGLIRAIHALDGDNTGQWIVRGPGKMHSMYRRKDKPYLTATIDGSLFEPETGEKGILEIKTHDIRGKADAEQWASGTLPQNYYVQCLHYLMVMGDMQFVQLVAKLRYFDWDGEKRTLSRTEIRYYRIERSEKEEEIAALERAETSFYENHVRKRVPPPIKVRFQ